MIFDNAGKPPRLIAFGTPHDTQIIDEKAFEALTLKSKL
jgi:hypothetical protein